MEGVIDIPAISTILNRTCDTISTITTTAII
jgi:hypothetical protein